MFWELPLPYVYDLGNLSIKMLQSLQTHLPQVQPWCRHITQARLVISSDPEIWKCPGLTRCKGRDGAGSRLSIRLCHVNHCSCASLESSEPHGSASSFCLWATAHLSNNTLTFFINVFLFIFKLARVHFWYSRMLRDTGTLSTNTTAEMHVKKLTRRSNTSRSCATVKHIPVSAWFIKIYLSISRSFKNDACSILLCTHMQTNNH